MIPYLRCLARAFTVLCVCFGAVPVTTANEPHRLAVLEFSGQSLEAGVLNAFSDAVRRSALTTLDSRDVKVMTREAMLAILRDMGKPECVEGDCEVETARNIGADYVVSGAVVLIEGTYVVTLKLHETKEGALLATEEVLAKSQLEALGRLKSHGRTLLAGLAASPRRPSIGPSSMRAPEATDAEPGELYTARVSEHFPAEKSHSPGLAMAVAFGFHTPGLGVEAAYYAVLADSLRIVPYVGLGYMGAISFGAGTMAVLGGRHRVVGDVGYSHLAEARSVYHVILAMAGCEFMSNFGIFLRPEIGVGYGTGHRSDGSKQSGFGPGFNLSVGHKFW